MRIVNCLVVMSILSVVAIQPARAQWAVVDAPATAQLIEEVKTMQEEVQTARKQLSQAQQALETMTGDRGMQLLLSGVTRNYLPTSWPQLVGAMHGASGGFSALTSEVRSAMDANAVLSPQQLSMLAPAHQQLIAASRQAGALQQSLVQEALANVSGRFSAIQTLVGAIGSAADQKGVLDLQARISAELGMLQNEQTKLQILRDATQAQDAVLRQQQREQAIAAHGSFATRFQPIP
jgi:type IV secretion system protein VirB5